MKDLINKLIANIHIVLFLYGLYSAYGMYETHNLEVTEIQNQSLALDGDIEQNQRKVREIQEFSKKTNEYKVRVEEVAKNIEAVQKQLPAETNDSQILGFFQGEMSSLNIKDSNFTPGKEDKSTYYITKEYSLKAKGTFLQFLIFLERIGTADRIYNIKTLKLETSATPQKGRFQVISGEGVIQAFRFNPDFKVDRGF
ncbi:type 4a pilus biogenesis protein PilO [Peredibacter starrii]|uniref:Type 4a pilus biogenesis protein PilO n=1 Tax=Peredibacter starrii TaxID=28202 RepID=A0AAX4HR08_9BACT|nr:type 4a pilus biogenesis protein PilO [Peredibacter starrii]WPU65538.1 type 4a pilus biogenesis protein PilO [Peredibacter starrii]